MAFDKSNCVVLKKILQHLSYEDLQNCSQVSKLWSAVSRPLMWLYRIRLEEFRSGEVRCSVERIRGYQQETEQFSATPCELIEHLKKEIQVSIQLQVVSAIDYETGLNNFTPFLEEFRDRVHTFYYESLSGSVEILKYINFLTYFPNLEVVRASKLKLVGHPGMINLLTAQIKRLPYVRMIWFDDSVHLNVWKLVLCMAQNVNELKGVPVMLAKNYPEFTNRYWNKIKSIGGYSPETGEDLVQFENSLRVLDQAGLKLIAGAIPNFYQMTTQINKFWVNQGIPGNEQSKIIQRHFLRILDSSKDTLKALTVPPASCDDYYLPANMELKAVELLIFEDNPALNYVVNNCNVSSRQAPQEIHCYFRRSTDLKKICPNIKAVEIKFNYVRHFVSSFLPMDTFGPVKLGSSIKNLKTSIISSYTNLSITFPSVANLKLQSTVENFRTVFPEICEGWPGLESLSVNIVSPEGFHSCPAYYSLDSALTGIPESVCTEIHQTREKHISRRQVDIYQRDYASLLRLRCLRRLEIIVEEPTCKICKQNHFKDLVSPIAVKYALEPLKNLKAIFKTFRKF